MTAWLRHLGACPKVSTPVPPHPSFTVKKPETTRPISDLTAPLPDWLLRRRTRQSTAGGRPAPCERTAEEAPANGAHVRPSAAAVRGAERAEKRGLVDRVARILVRSEHKHPRVRVSVQAVARACGLDTSSGSWRKAVARRKKALAASGYDPAEESSDEEDALLAGGGGDAAAREREKRDAAAEAYLAALEAGDKTVSYARVAVEAGLRKDQKNWVGQRVRALEVAEGGATESTGAGSDGPHRCRAAAEEARACAAAAVLCGVAGGGDTIIFRATAAGGDDDGTDGGGGGGGGGGGEIRSTPLTLVEHEKTDDRRTCFEKSSEKQRADERKRKRVSFSSLRQKNSDSGAVESAPRAPRPVVGGRSRPSVTLAELGDAPAFIPGLVADWPAIAAWQRRGEGGPSGVRVEEEEEEGETYAYLRREAGAATVTPMVSSDNVFRGDMRNYHPVEMTLSEFLDHEVEEEKEEEESAGGDLGKKTRSETKEGASGSAPRCCLYLAQEPLWSAATDASGRHPGLAPLLKDVAVPPLLAPLVDGVERLSGGGGAGPSPGSGGAQRDGGGSAMRAVNLWLCLRESHSSPHFDDHHNVLCVVAGRKLVTLWSPEWTRVMRPHTLGGESSNHSRVDVSRLPNGDETLDGAVTHVLTPGDALYIPEGWWHQVTSAPHTVAVNFWWESSFTMNLGGQLDSYYARKTMESLVAAQKKVRLARYRQDAMARMANAVPADVTAFASDLIIGERRAANGAPFRRFLAALSPDDTRSLLEHLAREHPAALAATMIRCLTPVFAEHLTDSFEAFTDRPADFFELFYGAFGDGGGRDAFASALFDAKDEFAAEVTRDVCNGLFFGGAG